MQSAPQSDPPAEVEEMGLTELLFRRTEAQSNVFASVMVPNFDVVDDLSPDQPSVDSLLVACLKPVPPGEDRQRIVLHSCLGDATSVRPLSKPCQSSALGQDAEVVAMKAEHCTVSGDESFLLLAFAFVKRKGESGVCIHRLPASEMRELTCQQGKVILPSESATVMPVPAPPWQVISAKFSDHGELKLALLVSLVHSRGSRHRPVTALALRRTGEFLSVSNLEHFFPEFIGCEEQLFFMESVFLEDRMQRLTAWGSDTGHFEVACVGLNYENEVLHRFSFAHSTPITALRLFPDFHPPRVASPREQAAGLDLHCAPPPLHLLVCAAAEPAVVYEDPLGRGGLSPASQRLLAGSGEFDCVLCACLADLDFDGEDEVVLGTYSGHLLAYKPESGPRAEGAEVSYRALSRQRVGGPVLAIHVGDLTGDGVKEVAVVTTRGVHIMQHPLPAVMDRLEQVLAQEPL